MTMTAAAPGSLTGAPGRPARILVVDDEPSLAELLTMALSYEGWDVRSADNGAEALRVAGEFGPDAVLLDVMLPDFDGVEVLRRLRERLPGLPVLFLTARDSAEDRDAGLRAGADGYLTKPFSLEQVVGRLQALIGVPGPADGSVLTVGDLALSVERRTVHRGGAALSLTSTEFDVLHLLMRRPGQVVPEEEIRAHVWGGTFGGRTNLVALTLTSLRRKVDAGREPLLHAADPAGYLIVAPA
ncbi:response regulator transcription factor [Actinoplanes sp. NPDC049599]|uniref:response regulator transcription factor n=1 Tax=Actinoplanes sp. NPDC049599 TaxID=3363903 RepID=UPI00378FAFC9